MLDACVADGDVYKGFIPLGNNPTIIYLLLKKVDNFSLFLNLKKLT